MNRTSSQKAAGFTCRTRATAWRGLRPSLHMRYAAATVGERDTPA